MSILAAVGGGPRDSDVVCTGWDLATAFDDRLVVVHVLDEEEFQERRDRKHEYYQEDAVEDATAVAKERAEEALDTPDIDGVSDITSDGTTGDPTAMILQKATEHNARYVVIGGRKRSPVGKALFGSTTQSILLSIDRPVVTVTEE
ncbi:universal stress protein [Natrinema gelatinilyticum]|uniref:universal stress protein n=1 Tax=Natrinema gelatinilyticum TaxID=2961571 RepID=UPI0020C49661|nr:universal stress protein [Natrinema gelatinilyticum]